jgi:hypothetical protein
MARVINWDEELSEEDRFWAEHRPDMPAGNGMTVAQRLIENDEKFGRVAKNAAKSREERQQELRTIIADSQNELERLDREAAEEANANVAVTGDPASGLIRDNTGVDGQRPAGAPEGSEDYSDEKYWTKAKLTDEIKKRNVEREAEGLEPMATTGNRAELVERLLKDDEEIEG